MNIKSFITLGPEAVSPKCERTGELLVSLLLNFISSLLMKDTIIIGVYPMQSFEAAFVG